MPELEMKRNVQKFYAKFYLSMTQKSVHGTGEAASKEEKNI